MSVTKWYGNVSTLYDLAFIWAAVAISGVLFLPPSQELHSGLEVEIAPSDIIGGPASPYFQETADRSEEFPSLLSEINSRLARILHLPKNAEQVMFQVEISKL
jgi:hypothetical protein